MNLKKTKSIFTKPGISSDILRDKVNIVAHSIQAAITTAALYPAVEERAFLVGAAIVAIDTDHYIPYVMETGRYDVRGMFRYYDVLAKNMDGYLGLSLFHTIECYVVLFLLGKYVSAEFNYALIGFLFHHALDQIYFSLVLRRPFGRVFSIAEYYARKKHYHTTLCSVMKEREKERPFVYQSPKDPSRKSSH